MKTRTKLVLSSLTAAALMAACSSTQDSAGPPAAAAEETVWHKVLGEVGEGGTVSTQTAVNAFSAAIAPLPGARLPQGRAERPTSGTLAVGWLMSHWGELDQEQQRQAAEALGLDIETQPGAGPGDGARPGKPGGRALGRVSRTQVERNCQTTKTAEEFEELQRVADETAQQISAKLGEQAPRIVVRKLRRGEVNDPRALGATLGVNARCGTLNGEFDHCVIGMTKKGLKDTPESLRNTVIHETFHCFQGKIIGDIAEFYRKTERAGWVIEGSAQWAASELGGYSDEVWWDDYLKQPRKSLFTRTYDAIGFYAHLSESGTDPWSVFRGMFTAADNAAAWAAGVNGKEDAFLDTWPSGWFRDGGLPWDITGPGVTATKPEIGSVALASRATTKELKAPKVSTAQQMVDIKAEVVTFTTPDGAHGRVKTADGGDHRFGDMAGTVFCTIDNCACPKDSPQASFKFTYLPPGKTAVAVASTVTSDATAQLRGALLKDFCGRKPGHVGTWVHRGNSLTKGPVTVRGGAGIVLTIADNGDATESFDGSTPYSGDVNAGGTQLHVDAAFQGAGTFHLEMADGKYSGTNPNFGGVSVSAKVTGPIKQDVSGMMSSQLKSMAGFVSGTYVLDGDVLTITDGATGLSWVFDRR